MSVRASLSIGVRATQSAPSPAAGGGVALNIGGTTELLDGTDDGECDLILLKEYTLAASGSQVVDLVGALTGIYGTTFSGAELVGLFVEITSGTGQLSFGADATNGVAGWWADASDREKLGGVGSRYGKYVAAGVALAAGTADELYFSEAGGANAVTFRVMALCRSA